MRDMCMDVQTYIQTWDKLNAFHALWEGHKLFTRWAIPVHMTLSYFVKVKYSDRGNKC
jgi:hypothetical protein